MHLPLEQAPAGQRQLFTTTAKPQPLRLLETAVIDPDNTPIPLVDANNWELCKKIHQKQEVCRLADVKEFSITRGEINQTIYREFITNNAKMSRLLKGVEVGRFHLKEKLSQGHRELFDEKRFSAANKAKSTPLTGKSTSLCTSCTA